MFKTIEWTADGVRMIDQTRLPGEEIYNTYTNYREVAEAIRSMVIRGAPAIGVAAAMGVGARGQAIRTRRRRTSCASTSRSSPTRWRDASDGGQSVLGDQAHARRA